MESLTTSIPAMYKLCHIIMSNPLSASPHACGAPGSTMQGRIKRRGHVTLSQQDIFS